MDRCEHVEQADMDLSTDVDVCEDCVALGDTWVHLNVCKTCGYVGCCDSSKNRHARKHYRETGHPIISRAGDATWYWCYPRRSYVERDGTLT